MRIFVNYLYFSVILTYFVVYKIPFQSHFLESFFKSGELLPFQFRTSIVKRRFVTEKEILHWTFKKTSNILTLMEGIKVYENGFY